MKCFYHNDADGKCSAMWVRTHVGLKDNYDNEFIEMDYRKNFPLEKINKNEQVYIVDYSIPPVQMRELLKITKDVTWIDHHKTAIEKYKDFEYDIRGIRYDGIAGCMLTYCYIHHMTDRGSGKIKPFKLEMTEKAPLFTKLIADWDVFKFDYGDDTRYFHIAFESHNLQLDSWQWFTFLNDDGSLEQEFINQGVLLIQYRDNWAKMYMKKYGYKVQFEGYKCYASNIGLANSDYFKSVPESDIFIKYCFDGEQYEVSLYSKTVDVSKIALKYGGGGHKGASGFNCKQLPFTKS